jgi:hypothetical protein
MSLNSDPVLVAIAKLESKVDDLVQKVNDHEKRLRWVVTAAVLVVGAIGGPDAVQLVSGGTA